MVCIWGNCDHLLFNVFVSIVYLTLELLNFLLLPVDYSLYPIMTFEGLTEIKIVIYI